MRIRVLYDGPFSDLTQHHQEMVTLAQPTLENLISIISQRYGQAFREMLQDPASGATRPQVAILVNGHHQAWDTPLDDGAEVAFLVPMAGGMP